MRRPPSQDIELTLGPHPARPDWRVLRISYANTPDHDARVVAAIGALYRSSVVQAAEADR